MTITRNGKEFSTKTKLKAWTRAGGCCEDCGRKLFPGDIRFDHIVAIALGGNADVENCSVKCRSCDAVKTFRQDIPAIAKGTRVRARHLGIRKPRRSFLTNKDGPFRKRLDGTVERRR